MSFVSTLRSLRPTRRPARRAAREFSTPTLRDQIIIAAVERAGLPPRH